MKKSLLVVFLFAIIAISCSQETQPPPSDTVLSGLKRLDDFEFAPADSLFAAADITDSSSNWGAYAAGLAQERQLQYYDAMETYLRLADEAPGFAPVWSGIARVYTYLDRPLKALEAAKQASELSTGEGSYGLAIACINAMEFDNARKALGKAVDQGCNKALAKLIEAKTWYMEHDLDRAESALGEAFAEPDTSWQFYSAAADYYEATGMLDSAVVLSRQAVQRAGGGLEAVLTHFQRCLRVHHLVEARTLIDGVRQKDERQVLTTRMETLYNAARLDLVAVFRSVNKYTNLVGESINSMFYEMKVRSQLADYFTGQRVLEGIELQNRMSGEQNSYRAFIEEEIMLGYLDVTLWSDAGRRLDSLVSKYGDNSRLEQIRATTLYCLGSFEDFEKLVKPMLSDADGHPERITRIADGVVHPVLLYYDDAEKYFHTALEQTPGFLPAFEHLVAVTIKHRDFEKAADVFEAYPHFAEHNPRLAVVRAICMAHSGQLEDATTLFSANIGRVSVDLPLFHDFLVALDRHNDTLGVTRLLETLVTLSSENPDGLALAADWSNEYRQYQQAVTLAEQAQQIEPGNLSAAVQKARAWFAMGKKRDAYDLFEELAKSHARDPELQLYHSQARAIDKKDMVITLNIAKEGLSIDRNAMKGLINLVFVYMQNDRYDLALGKARQVVVNFEEFPQPHFYLGKALYHEKRPGAKESLDKALELGLRGKLADEARQMIKNL